MCELCSNRAPCGQQSLFKNVLKRTFKNNTRYPAFKRNYCLIVAIGAIVYTELILL
jgi:hypothetical protein